MTQVFSRRNVTKKAWARFQASPSGICGRQNVTAIDFSPSTLIFS